MAKCPYCNNEYNSGESYTAHVNNCSYKNYDIQLIAQEKGTSVKNVRKEDLGEKAYQMSKQIQYLDSDIPNTKQVPTFTNGQVTKIQHIDTNNNVIREDIYTYTSTTITEVRKLATGETKTLITNLNTLETEVI